MPDATPAHEAAPHVQPIPAVMTPDQCAAVLGVSKETLLNWRKGRVRGGPRYTMPTERVVRYLGEDVLAWLREHRV